ncbi:MAG: amino acid adenylation domain-containing protein [Polyangiaceae bacterium]|nr:amino acid adenylation domain-containing protein [Polyangiaceae bacterium]
MTLPFDTRFHSVEFDPFRSGEIEDCAPSTAAQREVWVASQFSDEAKLAYNESITIHLTGPLDVPTLKASVGALARRHDALRSTFSRDGKLLCVGVEPEVPFKLVDLTGTANENRGALLQNFISAEVTTPFDLESGPLLRAALVKFDTDDHRLILGSHHIVCDGWSFAVLLDDLAAIYTSQVGLGERLKPEMLAKLSPAHRFADYARDEAGRNAEREETFWRGVFETIPDALDLPTDRPRPALRAFGSARVDLPIGSEQLLNLKKAGAKNGASLFVTLFSAFYVLMQRLSGQSDIVIGVPASAQSALGLSSLVGHCANLLPMRMRADKNARFADVLKAARAVVLDAYDHQRFTLGSVLPMLPLPRDPSRLPLVQVLFNLDTGMEGAGGLRFGDASARFRGNPRIAETFELFLNVFESHGTLALECQYSTALWDRQTIEAWLNGYVTLLGAITESWETSCADLPIVTADQRRALLSEYNATHAECPAATVVDLFRKQVSLHPQKEAVLDGSRAYTYSDVEARAAQVAGFLKARGIGRGKRVAFAVSRSADVVPLLLGILASGAAYIPVDPRYPAERMVAMVGAAAMVLVEPETLEVVTQAVAAAASTATVTLTSHVFESGAGQPFTSDALPDDVAYVIFTSGSTGVPNGVQISHKNLTNFVESMRVDPGMTSADVLVAVVTFSFDIAGYELYVPLCSGAQLHVASGDAASDGRELASLLTRSRATVLQAPPAVYRMLRTAGYDPKGLRALVGGESFPPDLAQWLLSSGATVVNCYGPTETTIWSTLYHVTEVSGSIPIGRPIGNTQVYALDDRMALRPIGAWGELYIGGSGVAIGYLDRPDMNSRRFVPDPFSDVPGARLHRTGDIGRRRGDGVLEIAGRNDDQVKIRGHRVELGEVEAALSTHPAVLECAAAAVREAGVEARLAVFFVLRQGENLTPTEVRRYLRSRLPEVMIPQLVAELPSLPRTPNGKIDRRTAVKLGSGQRHVERERIAPKTEAEKLLVELCERSVGGGALFGTNGNFFEGGGDSLTCMSIVSEIENRTRVRIPPRALILSTLGEVAKLVENAGLS